MSDPVARLHNICAALEEDLSESPFTREEWDRLDAERLELLKANDALAARLAEAEALLREMVQWVPSRGIGGELHHKYTGYCADQPTSRGK